MVAELGNVLQKFLKNFGKLLQKLGAAWLNERLDILREDVEGRRLSEERVEPVGLIFIHFLRLWEYEVWRMS